MKRLRLIAGMLLTALLALALPAIVSSGAEASSNLLPQPCRGAELQPRLRMTDGAAGSQFAEITVLNGSERRCTMRGYGKVFFSVEGTWIGAPSVHAPGQVTTFVLAPGERAFAKLRIANARNYPRAVCEPVLVDGLLTTPPGGGRARFLPRQFWGCRNNEVQLLFIQPYQPR